MRPILTGTLSVLLGLGLVTACDSDKGKTDAKKADAKKADAKKADDKKVDAKADDVKAADAKADDAKADDAKAADAKAAAVPPADGADSSGDGGAAAEDPSQAADGGDMKAADDAKADDKKADDKKADDKKDGGKKPEPAAKGPKIDAKGLYLKKCKSCHGVSGNADTKLGKKHDISDWTKPGWKGKWPQKKVENIITNGESGTKMKAFKDKLTADEIKAVAKYSRSLGK